MVSPHLKTNTIILFHIINKKPKIIDGLSELNSLYYKIQICNQVAYY